MGGSSDGETDGETVGEQLVRLVQSSASGTAIESGTDGPYLVVDLRGAVDRIAGRSDRASKIGEAAAELTDQSREAPEERGRGWFSKLLFVGFVVGAVYALRKRIGGPDRTPEDVAEETENLASRAASVVQRRGEIAAERIEEGSEALAGQIEEGGEEAAERMSEAGERMEETQEEFEESTAEMEETAREEAEAAREEAETAASEMDDGSDEDVEEE